MAEKILINYLCTDPVLCELFQETMTDSLSDFFLQKANNLDDFLATLKNFSNQVALIDFSEELITDDFMRDVLSQANNKIPVILGIENKHEEKVYKYLELGLHDYFIKSSADRLKMSILNAVQLFSLMKKKYDSYGDIVSNLPGCAFQFSQSPNGIYRMLFASEGIEKLSGLKYDYIKSDFQRVLSHISNEYLSEFFNSIKDSASNLTRWSYVFPTTHPDGKIVWIKGSSTPRKLENNEIVWSGVLLDVTKEYSVKKQYTEASTQDKQLKAIFNATVEAIVTIDSTGTIHSCNPATSKLFGYSQDELIGHNVSILMPPHDRKHHDMYISQYLKLGVAKVLGKGRNIKCMKKNGDQFPAYLGVAEYTIENNIMFVGLIKDTSEISETLEALTSSENKLREQKNLLELTYNSLTDYINNNHLRKTSESLLKGLLEITNSEYGITGEILKDSAGRNYLRVHSIAGGVQNQTTHTWFEENMKKGLEFHGSETLLSETYIKGEICLRNEPIDKSHVNFFPEAHPVLENYLGVPVFYGNQLIGMYGLANKAGGYDEELINSLNAFNTAYGVIIHSTRLSNLQSKFKKDLIIAKDAADSANAAKSQFLAKMSHELKTPLNIILGYTQLLEIDANSLSNSHKDNVFEIAKAGKQLLDLINNILDLSSIDNGKINLNIETRILDNIIKDCVICCESLTKEKNIKLINTVNLDCEIQTDFSRLKQILLNLISNAIKYNKENGEVVISAKQTDNSIAITVRDSGQGIPKKAQDRLFTSFDEDSSENNSLQSNGIGLYITQQLSQLLQGSINFISKEGEGSSFTLEIPIVYNHKSNAQSQDSSLNKKKVLYIEDNIVNLNLVHQILGLFENLEFYPAETPEKGLSIAYDIKPDLILLDINLPNMNGFEVFTQLQNDENTKNIDVIGVSANSLPSDIDSAIKAGFKDYITKPLNIQTFIQKVTESLNLIQ